MKVHGFRPPQMGAWVMPRPCKRETVFLHFVNTNFNCSRNPRNGKTPHRYFLLLFLLLIVLKVTNINNMFPGLHVFQVFHTGKLTVSKHIHDWMYEWVNEWSKLTPLRSLISILFTATGTTGLVALYPPASWPSLWSSELSILFHWGPLHILLLLPELFPFMFLTLDSLNSLPALPLIVLPQRNFTPSLYEFPPFLSYLFLPSCFMALILISRYAFIHDVIGSTFAALTEL